MKTPRKTGKNESGPAGGSRGQEVNRNELAGVFGCSLPTVDAWVRAGCPVVQRGSKGVPWIFNTADVAKWRQDRAVTDATGDSQADESEIERRTKRAKMLQAELAFAKESGLVSSIRDFERVQAARYAVIRANIMNVPARAVLRLLGETDETQFKKVLRAELVLALDAAAKEQLEISDDDEDDAAG